MSDTDNFDLLPPEDEAPPKPAIPYQVIARKWRPQKFEDVTGQEHITKTLSNAIGSGRLHHSYIFSGVRGVGKTTTARLLGKALNCNKASSATKDPCVGEGSCDSCREITLGRSIDCLEIDAASNNGVERVRETIITNLRSSPARDRYKIFIIDEVHMLTSQAFNALLKTVEEPPPRVIFIMATTELHKIPETILSRSQNFEFKTISTVKIFQRLKLIAKEEQISIPDDALREIARVGEGSMRDAQSAFDQVINFSGGTIAKDDVELSLGISGPDLIIRVMNAINENQPKDAMKVIDEVVMRGHDLRALCRDLLAHFRDVLMAKVSGSLELLESALCDPEELKRQAELFSESDLVRFFHSLAETEMMLQRAAHPRYQVEIGLVKLTEMRKLKSLEDIIGRLSQLEKAVSK